MCFFSSSASGFLWLEVHYDDDSSTWLLLCLSRAASPSFTSLLSGCSLDAVLALSHRHCLVVDLQLRQLYSSHCSEAPRERCLERSQPNSLLVYLQPRSLCPPGCSKTDSLTTFLCIFLLCELPGKQLQSNLLISKNSWPFFGYGTGAIRTPLPSSSAPSILFSCKAAALHFRMFVAVTRKSVRTSLRSHVSGNLLLIVPLVNRLPEVCKNR